MTARTSLATRILLASVVCGLLGAASTFVVGRMLVQDTARRVIATVGLEAFVAAGRAACEGAPSTWRFVDADGNISYAYDAETLTSKNPDAPPIARALAAQVEGEPPIAIQASLLGGRYIFRGASAGDCAIVQGVWHHPRPARAAWGILLGTIGVSATAAAVGLLLVVRPLTRRIARLRRSVEHVGDPRAFTAPEGPAPVPDEIGVVALGMVRAHRRITADAARLEDGKRALERHLADIAHDLRTPLASLQMTLERLAAAPLDDEGRALVAAALRDTVYITGLGANLRLASRLEEGWNPGAASAVVDLREVVARVAERFGFLAERSGIALAVAVPDERLAVRCDHVAAEQRLTNLLENAIAYGHPGGHVAVNLERRGDAGFLLEVLDDGPGVAPSELPRLAERTFRSDAARRRDPKGSGLGLAIVTEICERCGFRLAFEPAEPRGLRVRIEGKSVAYLRPT